MIETILLVLLALWCFNVYRQHLAPAAKPPNTQPSPVFTLTLDGSLPVVGNRGFVSQFGVASGRLVDLRYLPGPARLADMSAQMQNCLLDSFNAGQTRGPQVSGLLFRNEELADGSALYFALCAPAGLPPQLFTFVDRVRK